MDAPVPESSLREKPKTEIMSSQAKRKRTTSLPAKPDSFSQNLQACNNITNDGRAIMTQVQANIAERERIQKKNNEVKEVVETLASAIGTLRGDIALLKESARVVGELDTQREKQIELILSQQQTQTTLYAGASERLTKINAEYLEILPHVKNLGDQIKTLTEEMNALRKEMLQLDTAQNTLNAERSKLIQDIFSAKIESLTLSLEQEKSKVTQLQQNDIIRQSHMKFFGTISIMSLMGLAAAFLIWINTHLKA